MPRKNNKKEKKEGRDPYITRRYEYLGLIMSLGGEVDLTTLARFLSGALNLPKNQVYNKINDLAKEGYLLKNIKEGKTFIAIPDDIRQEMVDKALIIFNDFGKKMMKDLLENKKEKNPEILKFCRDLTPRLIERIEEVLKTNIPEPFISKELVEILTDTIIQFYHEEWVKSQLF